MRLGFPDVETAEKMLYEAEKINPGLWISHSRNVGKASRLIALSIPGMNADEAEALGILHDIGRVRADKGTKHVLDGFNICMCHDWPVAARICMTHSFVLQDGNTDIAKWYGTKEDFQFLCDYIKKTEYDDYDRIIQLCDSLATGKGFCTLEKRFVDTTFRYGFNDWTIQRWEKIIELKNYFESKTGREIYELLPELQL